MHWKLHMGSTKGWLRLCRSRSCVNSGRTECRWVRNFHGLFDRQSMRPDIERERRCFGKHGGRPLMSPFIVRARVLFVTVRRRLVGEVAVVCLLFSERRRPGRSGMVAHACPGRRLATLPGCRHLEPTPERVLSLSLPDSENPARPWWRREAVWLLGGGGFL